MNRYERLPTPQGVGPGQTATLNLPLGPTYHRFDLRMNVQKSGSEHLIGPDEWSDYVDDVRVIVDGDTKIEATADYLAKRAKFFGKAPTPGNLPVFLDMPWAQTIGGQDQTAYGTAGGMASFTLEFDIKDNVQVNKARVFAVQSAPRPFGPHLRISRFARSYAVTGVDEISDLPRGGYQLLGLDVTSADVDEIEIFANNNRTHVSDPVARDQILIVADRNPQAGMTHLDLMDQGRVNQTLPMALQDFRVRLDFTSQPGAYTIYAAGIHGA